MIRRIVVAALRVVFLVVGVMYILPLLITYVNSFKTMPELSKSFVAMPKALYWGNYIEVIKKTLFFEALGNSVFIAATSVAGIVLFTAMASYAITRRPSKFNRVLYIVFIMGMVMPFTTIMVPTMRLLGALNMTGTGALILMYIALGVSLATFVLTGFIKSSVPIEMEEAARIDGAGSLRIFFGSCCRCCFRPS